MSETETNLPVDAAEMAGYIAEAVGFGVSISILCTTTFLLTRKQRRPTGSPMSRLIMIITSFLLTFLVAAHWSIDTSRIYDGFIGTEPLPRGSLMYFANVASPRSVARTVVLVAEAVILDTLLVWRVWIIWGRNYWAALLPFASLLGTTVAGIGTSVTFSRVSQGETIFIPSSRTWIITLFSLTIVTHGMALILICYRVLKTNSAARKLGARSLWPLLQILIESSSITCVLQVITIITVSMSSNIQWIPVALLSPVIGIAFGLIVIRISLGVAGAAPVTFLNSEVSVANNEYALPMEIVITRQVEQDAEQMDHSKISPDPNTDDSPPGTPWRSSAAAGLTPPWGRNALVVHHDAGVHRYDPKQ